MERTRRRPTSAVILLVGSAAVAGAQEQGLPPGARLKILDLVFRVENVAGRVADLQV